MAARTRYLVFIIGMFILNNGCAVEQVEVIKQSKMNYENALNQYNKQIQYCLDKAQNVKIDRSILSDIKLTEPKLRIAIYWHYKKAQAKCENEKYGLFLIQRGIYREVLKHYKVKLDNDNPPFYDNYELFGGKYEDIELELKYFSYPKKERDKLDAIQELKKPFKLVLILKG
ncbi:hypothetical protein MNBD_GAMMA22-2426 [hydrothermal vent metagenome]|uniref:Uncharacterized protein n=1 Tax=hydrothermal vent metagenome TaxID=652676 RepID=A0A3B0ZME5_9ZZZZ